MSPVNWYKLLIIVSACSIHLCGEIQGADWPENPNIVLIYADDFGWSDTSFMGSQYYETPHLDQMAKEGMKFTNAYSTTPNCAPSRACLMTGLYTPRHGIYTVASSERGESKDRKLIPTPNTTALDSKFVTVAEVFREAGYATGSVGKWHLGGGLEGGPLGHGFDYGVGSENLGRNRSHFAPYENPTLKEGPEGEYLTDRLTEEAIRFIEMNQSNPFFLYLPHYTVHTPIQAKKEMIEKYRDKKPDGFQDDPTYAAMIESLDEGVGRILTSLDGLGLREKTLVLFFSDNGGHGAYTDNAPLRGAKGMLYEGGIRVPLVASLPGVIAGGKTSDTPVIGVDFFPTFCEVAGIPVPDDLELDGQSFVSLLQGKERAGDRALFWHFPAYLQKYSYAHGRGGDKIWRTTPVGVIRRGDWKLLEFFEDGHLELYNLEKDLSEENNLIEEEPEIAQELLQAMRSWRKEVNAPVPTELNPEYRANE